MTKGCIHRLMCEVEEKIVWICRKRDLFSRRRRGFPPVPHHSAKRAKVCSWQRPPVHGESGFLITAVGVLDIGDFEFSIGRNIDDNANQPAACKETIRTGTAAQR